VTSIERTAYPRFGRLVGARELDGLAPVAEEVAWATAVSRSDEHLLSLVVALKCFQRLGYFPRAGQVPPPAIERMRGCLGLSDATGWQPPDRTGRWQQQLVRERLGVVSNPERARSLAEQAIRSEAEVKNHPPDLINVVLEVLVREGLELPGFSTLDGIAARVRAEVNAGMLSGIVARMRQPEVLRVNNLLDVVDGKSGFDVLKRVAGKVDDRLRPHHAAQRQALDLGRDGNALDRRRDARSREAVPQGHRLHRATTTRGRDRTPTPPSPPHPRHDPGSRDRSHYVTITPGTAVTEVPRRPGQPPGGGRMTLRLFVSRWP
jgi:Domain of unknown function (DUF4158)